MSVIRRKFNGNSGELYVWGSGEMGQLGIGNDLPSLPRDRDGYPYNATPTGISGFSSISFHKVAAGDAHNIALTSHGQVYSWGASACGQLGHSDSEGMMTDDEGFAFLPVPRLISELSKHVIVDIACGDAHSAAVTQSGLLFTWGGGGCGQLGHPDIAQMPKDDEGSPYLATPTLVEGGLIPVANLSCGKAHSAAVTRTGALFTWGAGACGQLGHPSMVSLPQDSDGYPFQPCPRKVAFFQDGTVAQSSCGDVHTVVLTTDGAVFTFGGGSCGQLGSSDLSALPVDGDSCPYSPTPIRLSSLKDVPVKGISVGDNHCICVTVDGDVYAWGPNNSGQLGVPNAPSSSENGGRKSVCPRSVDGLSFTSYAPLLVDSLKPKSITAVSCGESHSIAITTHGDIYTWGACNSGQLGLNMPGIAAVPGYVRDPQEPYVCVPALVARSFGSRPVIQVAGGGVHNLAIVESEDTLTNVFTSLMHDSDFADVAIKSNSASTRVVADGAVAEPIMAHFAVLAVRAPKLLEFLADTVNHSGQYCVQSSASVQRYVPLVAIPGVSHETLSDVFYGIYSNDLAAFDSTNCDEVSVGAVFELHYFVTKFNITPLVPSVANLTRKVLQRAYPTSPLLSREPPATTRQLTVTAGTDNVSSAQPPAGNEWGLLLLPSGEGLIVPAGVYSRVLDTSLRIDLFPGSPTSSTAAPPPHQPRQGSGSPVSPTPPPHHHSLRDAIGSMQQDVQYSDIVLRSSDGGSFPSHKFLLAARSEYFHALLSSGFKETNSNSILLNDTNSVMLKSLLNFIYKDDLPQNETDISELLSLSDKFVVSDLKRICERSLINSISIKNAAKFLGIADRFSCHRLRERSMSFINVESNFKGVLLSEAFSDLDKELIVEVLQTQKRFYSAPFRPAPPPPPTVVTSP